MRLQNAILGRQSAESNDNCCQQGDALIEIGLRIHDWISNDKRATFDRAVDGRMSRTRDVQPTKNAVVGWNCRGPLGPIPNGVSSDKADL